MAENKSKDKNNIEPESSVGEVYHCERCQAVIHKTDPYCRKCGAPTPFKEELDKKFKKDKKKGPKEGEEKSSRKRKSKPLLKLKGKEDGLQNNLSDTQKMQFHFDDDDLQQGRRTLSKTRAVGDKKLYERVEPEKKKKRKKKSDKSEPVFWGVRIFSLVLILALVFGGYFIYRIINYTRENANNAESLVTELKTYVDSNDAGSVAKLMTTENQNLLNSDVQPIIDKLNGDPDYKEEIFSSLDKAAHDIDQGQEVDQTSSQIKIIEKGRGNFGLKNYGLTMDPVTVNYNFPDGVNLLINENNINSGKGQGKRSIFPGTYRLTVQSKDNSISFDLDLTNKNSKIENQSLKIDYDDLRLQDSLADHEIGAGDRRLKIRTVGHPGALVFVNGENTGLTVTEFNELGTSDIETGDRVKIVIKGESGLQSSPDHTLGRERWVRLHIDYDQGQGEDREEDADTREENEGERRQNNYREDDNREEEDNRYDPDEGDQDDNDDNREED